LGLVFGAYSLVSVIRVFFLLTGPDQNSDFFKSGALETLILLAYQMLFIIQTYSLILMVNRRLIRDVASQEERFHTMADFTCDWEYWIGPDMKIIYMAPFCEQVTGYRVEEFIRDPDLIAKIVHPDDVALVGDHFNKAPRSEFEDSIDFRIVTRNGELRWINHICRPVYSAGGRWLGRRISNRDFTTRKQAEEALKKSEEELQEKNEALTNLLYAVSHDLKSPLVTIKSFAGFLKQDISRQDQMAQMKDIGFIQNAAEQMGVLLDELLNQSRISGKERHKEEMMLETVVKAALNLVAGQISKRQALVELTDSPVILYGDPQRLIRLYQNLIDNALKFMGNQPAPQVKIGVIEREGRLVLYVQDNGSGIDLQHHKRIFDLFEKGNAQAEGTGIGLALVKGIVELHNGQIWCESEGPGKGTTFYFTLEGTRWGKSVQGSEFGDVRSGVNPKRD
jgi:PAS domain S-box-containing protein